MSREYTAVIGSGQVPHVAAAPPYSIAENTYPIPSQRDAIRTQQGQGAVILNPEDFSVSIGLRAQAVTVGTSATPLPANPLEYRRALVVHNNSGSTVFLGDSMVTTGQGLPLAAGEKISFDVAGTPNVTIYAVASTTVDVRLMELA